MFTTSQTKYKAIILWVDMEMRQISKLEIETQVLKAFKLDRDIHNINSIEAIAGLLRRSAGFLCPCTEKTITSNVEISLKGLVDDIEATSTMIKETLEALISYGDLLEHQEVSKEDKSSAILIYTAPPAFVKIRDGSVFLLGILPDRITLLSDELESKIVYKKHMRRLYAEGNTDLPSELIQLGFFELPLNTWLKAPKVQTASSNISRINRMLDEASPSGEIPGLMALDSSKSANYYRGRWVSPDKLSGRFIARRKQLYGADIWCYVELDAGVPQKFIDFPIRGSIWRGCDEAWFLQAAIDFSLDRPQKYRLRPDLDGSAIIDLFAPVPVWIRRQLDALGEQVDSSGCLFSYLFRKNDIIEVVKFIKDRLWLEEIK